MDIKQLRARHAAYATRLGTRRGGDITCDTTLAALCSGLVTSSGHVRVFLGQPGFTGTIRDRRDMLHLGALFLQQRR